MSLRICVLGSGSKGNCTYVSSGATSLLIDAGLSCRETTRRLEAIEASPGEIDAICLSHEHSDHTSGLRLLHTRHGIPLYANAGTAEGVERERKLEGLAWQIFTTGSSFAVGDIHLEAFSVPHDAYDPVGFIVQVGEARIGIVTDMGTPTTLIRERLRPCQALVVESNHDERMLNEAERPWHLKQRILGRQGHLSNDGAADLLAEIASPSLRHVFLAHISDECNDHELALQTTRNRLQEHGHEHVRISVTYPDRVSDQWSYD